MKSINHILSESILHEIWKAHMNGVTDILSEFQENISDRNGPTLRTSKERSSFVSVAANLWNKTSQKFRKLQCTPSQAKTEIQNFVRDKIPSL